MAKTKQGGIGSGLTSGDGTQLIDVAGATSGGGAIAATMQGTVKTSFLMPKKLSSELTPNEQKIEELREECERMRLRFEKSKDNIRKIQGIIRYKPISHLIRPEDLDSDDEPTEEEKFLLNLGKVQSKIAHIWRGSN